MDRTYRTSTEPLDTVMPLAILINGGTASAAEIVSGSLQDMDRAVLVGQRSFGKGLVQAPRDLPYNGKVKITMSKYYIRVVVASSKSIIRTGTRMVAWLLFRIA